MPRLHSSRRAPALKESDYDHVIDLINHDSPPASLRPISSDGVVTTTETSPRPRSSSSSTTSSRGKAVQTENARPADAEPAEDSPGSGRDSWRRAPSIEIQEATPGARPEASVRNSLSRRSSDEGPVIDVLYENERGGFLCGISLFSSKALGNLDPTPWTNTFHKASPSDIHTAQVPDPTWEWAWPEWRVYYHDDVDEGGWEYSFMFARKFSWHGPRWWNSFVRRRAWIRKRIKRKVDFAAGSRGTDPHMLNADYFTVRPASEARSQSGTQGTSRAGSGKSAGSQMSESDPGFDDAKQHIEDVESLLYALRRARIDREKAEAVGIYLERGADLAKLGPRMHDIMALFVFQTSRKMLLANLTRALDETLEALENGGSAELGKKKEHLEGAIKCADDEVRRLAYWSDIKGTVEGGESASAASKGEGWGGEWMGVDQSGPAVPRGGDEDKSQL